MPVIELTDVSKQYGDTPAVDDLSLTINQGEIYGLLGPNGAGKTTTIEMITGQITPDSGSLTVLGTDPVTHPVATRELLGILPEREAPPSFMTPREYFHMIGDIRDIDAETVSTQVEEWSERLVFTDQLDTLHTQLSRGQQQKVMIVQAFLHDPEVVVIDEPLVNLDPQMQDRVKTWLTREAGSDRTILLSTHDIGVAVDICTRVGVVSDGGLAAETQITEDETEETILSLFEGDHIDSSVGIDRTMQPAAPSNGDSA